MRRADSGPGGNMVESDDFTYIRGRLSADQIEGEIARFWAELKVSSELEDQLDAAGVSSGALTDIDRRDMIAVRVDSSGADPASVLLVIAFAPAANRVLKDLWATVLLPRIRRRWGDDAMGDEFGRRSS